MCRHLWLKRTTKHKSQCQPSLPQVFKQLSWCGALPREAEQLWLVVLRCSDTASQSQPLLKPNTVFTGRFSHLPLGMEAHCHQEKKQYYGSAKNVLLWTEKISGVKNVCCCTGTRCSRQSRRHGSIKTCEEFIFILSDCQRQFAKIEVVLLFKYTWSTETSSCWLWTHPLHAPHSELLSHPFKWWDAELEKKKSPHPSRSPVEDLHLLDDNRMFSTSWPYITAAQLSWWAIHRFYVREETIRNWLETLDLFKFN